MSTDLTAAFAGVDLDMLAYDIAEVLDHGHGDDLDLSQDDIRVALPEFLAAAIAHARATDIPTRAASGVVIHTCNGDNRTGLPFGRKAPAGQCARCDQLRAGAEPRGRYGQEVAVRCTPRLTGDARRNDEILAHFASARHTSGGCGPVCTYGDA